MQAIYKGGSSYYVRISSSEVAEWNRKWPCSSLKGSHIFEFDRKSGDLLDHLGKGDGGELLALSEDAQKYALSILTFN